MKLRLVLISLGLCVIGASWAVSRPVTDKHVFAPTAADGAVEAASTKQPDATPDPNQSYDDGPAAQGGQQTASSTYVSPYQPAATPVPTPVPTATPQPEPTSQPTPEPTIAPKPLPTPIGCGHCGQYPINSRQAQIMCPMHMTPVYCLE